MRQISQLVMIGTYINLRIQHKGELFISKLNIAKKNGIR